MPGVLWAGMGRGSSVPAQAQAKPVPRRADPNATVDRKNLVATRVKAYAWQDEGIDKLLDNLQEKRDINSRAPESVKTKVHAALEAGADGIVLSREYTEVWLANLSAAGDAFCGIFAKG